MRYRESIKLDGLIDERRKSLARTDLSGPELDRRSKALTVLIDARNELDELGRESEKEHTNAMEVSSILVQMGIRKYRGIE